MTRRYNLTLRIDTSEGDNVLAVTVNKKTMDTLQQLIRLAMSDFEKVDPSPTLKRRWGRSRPVEIPIEPMEDSPSERDIENV